MPFQRRPFWSYLSGTLAALLVGGCTNVSPTVAKKPVPESTREPLEEEGDNEKMPFKETESGLKYRLLKESDGKKPTAEDSVTVHYRGWLDDGTEFDSSYKRNEPTSFPLNRVIKGWTEGLQLVGEGGKIELEIPPDLGYGARGAPGAIPPNATLHFEVELIKVQ
ncbi:putative FKBP-type peptidyl-prolyl cis-trans isomerase [Planctomycetes bacterium Pan216]|uniref:Peptidyl-prolyl cis-trans isomerase n=1 Tax=Kolteria novifilia TaxID=2527975 RepID=A0A518B6L5_9BACT|nr:putative FKBP-type peptidyl-prolyl cis-trans isomerase [Planctomycetes bacterium Pan216]